MQFFSTPRTPAPTTPPPAVIAAAAAQQADALQTPADGCGWFDSSFDLGAGLIVTEQDSDLDYLLCKLS